MTASTRACNTLFISLMSIWPFDFSVADAEVERVEKLLLLEACSDFLRSSIFESDLLKDFSSFFKGFFRLLTPL